MSGKKVTAFDLIISELMKDDQGPQLLAESLRFDVKTLKNVPLRYRIIALGFVRGLSLEELQSKLRENGCAQLYARSLWEAGLFYAFLHGLSYEEWKHLYEKSVRLRQTREFGPVWFQGGNITYQELEAYLAENSDEERQLLATRHLTRLMEQRIAEAATGEGGFEAFLTENIRAFSMVREKTRYYFCKYLYYYLRTRIDRFEEALRGGASAETASEGLSVFKGISALKRKKMSPAQARAFLEGCAVSCGEIFDAFSYFYFEYTSLDWVHVLEEYYGSLECLPEEEKIRLAAALRRQDPRRCRGLTDDEIIDAKQAELDAQEQALDAAYALDSAGRGYQRDRAGENTLRKYIRGTLDIDRTTLVCFLLFFGAEAELPEEQRITGRRLSEILLSCGFPALRPEEDFDAFILGYLEADDRVEFLLSEVTNYALAEENSHLYQMYRQSTSYHEEFEKLTGEQR